MTNITIPPAALEAGALATLEELDAIAGMIGATRVEGELTPEQQEFFRRIARAAFLAMIEAWPGSWNEQVNGSKVLFDETPNLILPLTEAPQGRIPTENPDAEA